jgi:hypothetical protein
VIDQTDISALQAAFKANPKDVGVGLYNPGTGEIRLGSFDLVTQRQGHQGLADALGIADNSQWRGFLVSSDGKFCPTSHFNLSDGGLQLMTNHASRVQQELKQAGLIS